VTDLDAAVKQSLSVMEGAAQLQMREQALSFADAHRGAALRMAQAVLKPLRSPPA